LEVTTKKIRDFCETDIEATAATGKLLAGGALHAILATMDRCVRLDSQNVESINSLIKLVSRRAPMISLELLSSRIMLKKKVREGCPPTATKWSALMPQAISVFSELKANVASARAILLDGTRWRPPEPLADFVASGLATSKLPSSSSPEALQWAATYVRKCSSVIQAQTGGSRLASCIVFVTPGDNKSIVTSSRTSSAALQATSPGGGGIVSTLLSEKEYFLSSGTSSGNVIWLLPLCLRAGHFMVDQDGSPISSLDLFVRLFDYARTSEIVISVRLAELATEDGSVIIVPASKSDEVQDVASFAVCDTPADAACKTRSRQAAQVQVERQAVAEVELEEDHLESDLEALLEEGDDDNHACDAQSDDAQFVRIRRLWPLPLAVVVTAVKFVVFMRAVAWEMSLAGATSCSGVVASAVSCSDGVCLCVLQRERELLFSGAVRGCWGRLSVVAVASQTYR
jgi:hypothetical protein